MGLKIPVNDKTTDLFLEQNISVFIGLATLDYDWKKTHAIAQILFKKSYKEAEISFTRDQIQFGWPSHVNDPWFNPGFTKHWISSTNSIPMEQQLVVDFSKKCLESVKKVTINFDAESTYENSLLKPLLIRVCRDNFPNLSSYALVFSSV